MTLPFVTKLAVCAHLSDLLSTAEGRHRLDEAAKEIIDPRQFPGARDRLAAYLARELLQTIEDWS